MQVKEARQYAEQADELFKQLGQAVRLSIQLFAVLHWFAGDLQKARSLLFEQQQRWELLGEKYIHSSLIACPFFQKPENSIPFLGVIDHHRRQLQSPIDSLRKRYYDSAERAARAALGDDAFEAACAEGARLNLDEALDLMLQKVMAL